MNAIIITFLGVILSMNVANAETYVVSQEKKSFSKKTLTIKVGDTIDFPNKDPFFHNVYSLSVAKSFELGSYPRGESRKIVFDEPGVVEIECAIHPVMHLLVTVKP